ncbi:unnamed protein product [Heligmosomoides polygyrus]|uniref:Uncharacterized protein n=1 Tax=Heligmosomoides polygyrus TaxID=6339 RepID=A0A183F5I2_HELPZ|nr:unnamed protein product [Heligmosomoides polygyrus]
MNLIFLTFRSRPRSACAQRHSCTFLSSSFWLSRLRESQNELERKVQLWLERNELERKRGSEEFRRYHDFSLDGAGNGKEQHDVFYHGHVTHPFPGMLFEARLKMDLTVTV